jgi:Transcriptional regulator, AbiEi antitoxin
MALVNELAGRQHGVVTRAQLLRAGLSRDGIDNRVKAGWLRPVHRGVYAVGPITVTRAAEMAAVLACGEGAVLSHHSAAALWQILPYPAGEHLVHVTVPRGRAAKRPGIHVRRVKGVQRDETTTIGGIPTTTPARTLLDVTGAVTPRHLEQALAEAERRRLANRTLLLTLLARYPARPGSRSLRALLEDGARPALTRSEAEERLLGLVRGAQLPAPDVNVRSSRSPRRPWSASRRPSPARRDRGLLARRTRPRSAQRSRGRARSPREPAPAG